MWSIYCSLPLFSLFPVKEREPLSKETREEGNKSIGKGRGERKNMGIGPFYEPDANVGSWNFARARTPYSSMKWFPKKLDRKFNLITLYVKLINLRPKIFIELKNPGISRGLLALISLSWANWKSSYKLWISSEICLLVLKNSGKLLIDRET